MFKSDAAADIKRVTFDQKSPVLLCSALPGFINTTLKLDESAEIEIRDRKSTNNNFCKTSIFRQKKKRNLSQINCTVLQNQISRHLGKQNNRQTFI